MIEFHQFPIQSGDLALRGQALIPSEARGSVVLLHGLPSTGPPDPLDEGYRGFASRFARRRWAAVWADMRAAREAPGYFSLEGWVEDATAIIETARVLTTGPLVIVAISAGGVVALEAVRRGAKAMGVVLLATPAEWVSLAGDAMQGVERIQTGSGMQLSPESLADPEVWAADFEKVTGVSAVSRVDVPVLIVHGTADDVVPFEHSLRLEAAAPHAERFAIEGAGHQLRSEPEAVDRVMEWIEHLVASASPPRP